MVRTVSVPPQISNWPTLFSMFFRIVPRAQWLVSLSPSYFIGFCCFFTFFFAFFFFFFFVARFYLFVCLIVCFCLLACFCFCFYFCFVFVFVFFVFCFFALDFLCVCGVCCFFILWIGVRLIKFLCPNIFTLWSAGNTKSPRWQVLFLFTAASLVFLPGLSDLSKFQIQNIEFETVLLY